MCLSVWKWVVLDLRLKEFIWVRLLALLIWTILVMLKRGISQLIDVIEGEVFVISGQSLSERARWRTVERATFLPPASDELVLTQIWPLLHWKVNISSLWRLRMVNRAWREGVVVCEGRITPTLNCVLVRVRVFLSQFTSTIPCIRDLDVHTTDVNEGNLRALA